MIKNNEWRIQLETKYTLICKICSHKVLDPDKKSKNQVFTKAICAICYGSKTEFKLSKVEKYVTN